MKKTTRKTTSKPRATKAIRDLDVKRAKDGTVRGGKDGNHSEFSIVKLIDAATPKL